MRAIQSSVIVHGWTEKPRPATASRCFPGCGRPQLPGPVQAAKKHVFVDFGFWISDFGSEEILSSSGDLVRAGPAQSTIRDPKSKITNVRVWAAPLPLSAPAAEAWGRLSRGPKDPPASPGRRPGSRGGL